MAAPFLGSIGSAIGGIDLPGVVGALAGPLVGPPPPPAPPPQPAIPVAVWIALGGIALLLLLDR
jgi:hypothetical protein